jgi:hypothetical protein
VRAEDHHRLGAAIVIRGLQHPPAEGANAEHVEEVAGHELAPRPFRFAIDHDADGQIVAAGNAVKRPRLIADISVVGKREARQRRAREKSASAGPALRAARLPAAGSTGPR